MEDQTDVEGTIVTKPILGQGCRKYIYPGGKKERSVASATA